MSENGFRILPWMLPFKKGAVVESSWDWGKASWIRSQSQWHILRVMAKRLKPASNFESSATSSQRRDCMADNSLLQEGSSCHSKVCDPYLLLFLCRKKKYWVLRIGTYSSTQPTFSTFMPLALVPSTPQPLCTMSPGVVIKSHDCRDSGLRAVPVLRVLGAQGGGLGTSLLCMVLSFSGPIYLSP